MANSGQAAEALEYYYRAIDLNPTYVRARYNLGISCINLKRYSEGTQHILDALSLQDAESVHDSEGMNDTRGGITSNALWDSLKTACLHMRRIDLATLCDKKDLEGMCIFLAGVNRSLNEDTSFSFQLSAAIDCNRLQ
jgi:peroxin-5